MKINVCKHCMTPLIWIYEAVNLTSHLYKEQYVLKK